MTLKERVGLRIRAIRKHRGFTQGSLGEVIGRSPDAVSQIERGVNLPSFETLERLAEVLSVPLAGFFEFDEPDVSARRTMLITTLVDMARKLSDGDLEVAVSQMKALAERGKASA